MKSLRCILFERQAARLAVTGKKPMPGSSLEQHLRICDSCRQAVVEFSQITTSLSELPAASSSHSDLADLAWMRLQSNPVSRPVLARNLTMIAAATSIAALLYVFTRPVSNKIDRGLIPELVAKLPQIAPGSGDVQPRRHLESGNQMRQVASRSHESSPIPSHRRHKSNHRSHRIHRSVRRLAQSTPIIEPTRKTNQSRVATTAARTDWAQVGAYYEYYGDYRSAAVAYHRALDSAPTATLLYQAGRAAEYSGDVESAVEHLSQLLIRPTNKSKNTIEKGSLPWTEKPHSA